MHYVVSVVVDMVEDNTVAAIEVVEVASVVDTGVEVVRLVATAEMIPRRYLAVAIVAVAGLVDMGLVVVALCIPPYNVTQYTFNSECIFSTTQSMIGSNYSGIR